MSPEEDWNVQWPKNREYDSKDKDKSPNNGNSANGFCFFWDSITPVFKEKNF